LLSSINRFYNTLCHKAPDEGGQAFACGDVVKKKLNHYPTRYRKAFALFIISVRRFPMPRGYGFIPNMGESAGLTRSI